MTAVPGHPGDALSALVDGELSSAEAVAVRAHLAGCPECSAELDGVSEARAWVRGLPPVEPPAAFYRALALPDRRRRALAALAGTAVAAMALVSFRSPPSPSVTPPVRQLVEDHAATASAAGDPVTPLVPVGLSEPFGR